MADHRVLLLGDFIRLSYHPRVAALFEADPDVSIEVVGPAVSTGSSVDLAENLQEYLDRFRPDAVHFNAGLEDVCWHRGEQQHEVAIADYEMNLQRIVEALKAYLGGDVVFATTTPVIDDIHNERADFERCNRDIEEYNIAAQQIMLANDVLINHLERVIGEQDDEFIAPNGVDLTPAGIEAAAQAVYESVRSLWH